VAIEANPHNAAIMQKNCDMNGIKNIEIVQAAIDEKDGELFFNEGLNGKVDTGNGEWGKVKTDAVCIDTLVNKYGDPDLIFLDVEGFELNALHGCTTSFPKVKSWFIEVHSDYQLQSFGGSVENILKKFPPDLYNCFVANDNERDFKELIRNEQLTKMMEKRFYLIALRA
jgi:FkbM family methyltransferase